MPINYSLLYVRGWLLMGMVVTQPYVLVSKLKKNHEKVPTLYWLPKLHKKPYKARFIAYSSSCTTTKFSKLLTSCLTAVKNILSSIVKRYIRDPVKTYFGLLKIQVKILDKLKVRDFTATSLSTYDFSTLYTTFPHNLNNDRLIDLIERTFQREGSPYLACNDRNAFCTSEKPKKYYAWSCQNVCDALIFCWTTFLFNLAPSGIDK